jgi:hypothetical protein
MATTNQLVREFEKVCGPAPLKSAEQFIVLCGKADPWAWDHVMSRSDVLDNVSRGEYGIDRSKSFNHMIAKIVAFDLDAGTSRDATKDITDTVIERWAQDGKELSPKQREWVSLCKGEAFANAFRTEAA